MVKKDQRQIQEIVPNADDSASLDFLTFEPKEIDRQWKAQFWDSVTNSPVYDPTTMSLSGIISLARGGEKLRTALLKPEYRSWFFNQNIAKIKIQASAELAVNALIQIMLDDNPKLAASRVKAAELILKYSGLEPTKRIDVTHKELPQEEVDSYLDDALRKLNYVKVEEK